MPCEYYERCTVRKTLIDLTIRTSGSLDQVTYTLGVLNKNYCQTARKERCPHYKSQRQ